MKGIHEYDLNKLYSELARDPQKRLGTNVSQVKDFFKNNNLTAHHYYLEGKGYQIVDRSFHKRIAHNGLNKDVYYGRVNEVYGITGK